MLIEFFGSPGAGKSTLSHLVAHYLSERGYAVDEVTYEVDHTLSKFQRLFVKLASISSYICRHPICAASDISRILGTQQATFSDARRAIFNWLYVTSVVTRAHSSESIVILDQGLAQAIWSVGFAARRKTWLDLCLSAARKRALKPDLIVHVSAKLQSVGDRLKSREQRISRIDHLGDNLALLGRSQENVQAIAQIFEREDVRMIGVKNDSRPDLSLNALRIVDAILSLAEKREEPSQPRLTRCFVDRAMHESESWIETKLFK